MAKSGYSVRYESLVKDIIYHILGFEEEDENYEAAFAFVMSNLLYHHCLDVNSHDVQRALQGIAFKMEIHGHQKKGEKLNSLLVRFLKSPDVHDQGDLKWSILSLLIELSQHPARDCLTSSFVSEHDCVSSLEVDGSEEESWLRELKEKSVNLPDKDETLSEWSDDEEIRRSLSLGNESDEPNGVLNHCNKNLEWSEDRRRQNALVTETHLSKSRLANVVQSPYWDPEARRLIVTADHDDGLREMSANLTEYCVMRECVWLFLHPSCGYVFLQDGKDFKVNSAAALSSIPTETLEKFLQPVTCAASKLYEIDAWLRQMRVLSARKEKQLCGTLESYSEGLVKWRRYFNLKVKRLEDVIAGEGGEESPTLLWFLSEMEPYLSNLSIVYNVHSKTLGIREDNVLTKSSKLICFLVQCVETGLSHTDRVCVSVLLNYALKNYCKCLSSILCNDNTVSDGVLSAFFIKRNIVSGSNKFVADEDRCMDLAGLEFLRAIQSLLIEICELKELGKDLKVPADLDQTFLEKLIEKEIFGTEDSVETQRLNNNLSSEPKTFTETSTECSGNVSEINAIHIKTLEDTNMLRYKVIEQNTSNANSDDVIESKSENCNKIENQCEKQIFGSVDTVNKSCESTDKVSDRVCKLVKEEINSEKNGHLMKVGTEFESRRYSSNILFLEKAFEDCDEILVEETQFGSSFNSGDIANSMRLGHRLTNALVPVVKRRSLLLGKMLMSSFVADHGLKQQINTFKSVVLLSSVDLMNEFYSYFFHKIDGKELIEGADLTQNLQYCINFTHPDLAKYFAITLRNSAPNGVFATEVFSSISLEFEDLWPLSVIIDESALSKYNKIFVFFLMLKRAAFTLARLHFKDIASFETCCRNEDSKILYEEGDSDLNIEVEKGASTLSLPQRIHRLQLLRQWLLYFARLFHDHFSTAVFVPFSQRLEKLLEIEHFLDFVKEHDKLLNDVCHQCLFTGDKLTPIQNALTQIFATVEKVRELWNGPPSKITEDKLDCLDDQYSTCHRFMEQFLSTVAATRLCPLVEGLANSLSYNCPA